jgi:tRNAHis guanylyltransferase
MDGGPNRRQRLSWVGILYCAALGLRPLTDFFWQSFTDMHKFEKPNDLRAIHLMNMAALEVVRNIRDIIIAYGQSDEYR